MHLKNDNWSTAISFKKDIRDKWKTFGLKNFKLERPLTRLEIAILFDTLFDPFNAMDVDLEGYFKVKN